MLYMLTVVIITVHNAYNVRRRSPSPASFKTRILTSFWCHSVPGTINVHGAPIQILDLPGIIEGAKDGRGRGRQVIAGRLPTTTCLDKDTSLMLMSIFAVARSCSLLFIVLDVLKPLGDKAVIENELEGFGIRLVSTSFNQSSSGMRSGILTSLYRFLPRTRSLPILLVIRDIHLHILRY